VGKRLFIAVDIDDPTRDAVDQLSRALRQDSAIQKLGRASWVSKDRMHLTLQFAADADAGAEGLLLGALGDLGPYSPFNLTFQGLGFFPERGAPRVLWLGIAEGLDELRAIHGELGRRLKLGERSGESFHPHLTLARFRDRVHRGRVGEMAEFPAAAGPSRIDRVTLYESRLSPKGPIYTALAQAPLKASS
jgi:RNA 2',3'-cyclic 3'-phosphodiesterase